MINSVICIVVVYNVWYIYDPFYEISFSEKLYLYKKLILKFVKYQTDVLLKYLIKIIVANWNFYVKSNAKIMR